jgi:hypothetical protein
MKKKGKERKDNASLRGKENNECGRGGVLSRVSGGNVCVI